MVSLVLVSKVAVLLTGAAAAPGGPSRHSTELAVGISSSGLPIDAGGGYTMTPLGAMWSRTVNWLRNRPVTAPRDSAQAEDQAAPARPAPA
jgi:hypothetical protein